MRSKVPCLLLLTAALAAAQVETARITGTITDSSGAAVPAARVVLTNSDTGVSSDTFTREDGSYQSVPLRIGQYRVAVEAPGFRRAVREGITLQIQQTAVINIALEVGDVTQEISVTAAAPLLNTSEATQGQVIDNQKMVELPLNGREYGQLALLSAGTNEPANGARVGGFSGNGMRATQNNYMLDGVDNNNSQIAYQGRQAEVVRPNVDAIQEFKVMTNAFSAEYGRAAGAVVVVNLKSGSNEFHGSLFEFLRNEKLDAKNFFDLPDQPRPPFKRNQYGFTLGGPVKRNQTFFFGDYEWTKVRESRTVNNTVPTPAMLAGDFSELLPGTRIYDPATYDPATRQRQPFPGNIIPASRFDPIGAKIAALYPTPNKPGRQNNFLYNPADSLDRDRWDAKADHHFGPSDILSFRYSYQRDFEPVSYSLPPPAFGAGGADSGDLTTTGHNLMLNHNHVFSPSFILSAKAAWNKIYTGIEPAVDRNYNAELGIRGVEQVIPGMAAIQPSGYASLGLGTHLPNNAASQNRQLLLDFSWLRARHTVKYGINFSWKQGHLYNPQQAMGTFPFDGSFTRNPVTAREGNPIADLLLGYPWQANTSNYAYMNQRAPFYDFYIQDEWRATSRLTLNFGVRYELHLPWVETRNGWSNFDIDTDPANPQLVMATEGSRYDRATIRTDTNDWGPRFGFAYRATDKWVARGGYGVYFAGYEAMGGGEYLQTNPPFHYKAQLATDRVQPTLSLSAGLPPDLATAENAANIRLSSYDRGGRHAYSHQWSFSVQRELPANSIVEIGYQANSAHKLMRWTEANWALPGPGNINLRRRYQSVVVPGEGVAVGPLASSWRHEPSANSNYHSLQLRYEKRFSAGLSLLSSYQWSKAISDGRGTSGSGGSSNAFPQNPLNLAAERSLADEHRAHRFVASYVYELPFGRGRAWISSMNPVLNGILGGWTIAGITTLNSGRPLTLTVQGNPSNTGGPDRPNVVGEWRLDADERTLDRWFDTSAFVPNAPFTFGNAGRNTLFAPREFNLDLAIHKVFQTSETTRLQFRFEAFNATNTPTFGAPNTQVGNPNFGVIGSAGRPRNLQLGLKFIF